MESSKPRLVSEIGRHGNDLARNLERFPGVFRERLLSADKAIRQVIDEARYSIFLEAVPLLVYVAVV
jgi:hypothetical protein